MRSVVIGCCLSVLGVAPVLAQAQGDTATRPALSTVSGDTGLWFVPTAEVLPSGKIAASLFRANTDRKQGLSDVSNIGGTVAFGATDRLEVFGAWSVVRVDRDVEPLYTSADADFGGITNDLPYLQTGWSDNVAGPLTLGAKWNLLSQSRQNGISLAPRLQFTLPTGSARAGTDALVTRVGIVASGEAGEAVELTGNVGAVIRNDPDNFDLSNGIGWGVGAAFPSRSPLRAIIEAWGESPTSDTVRVTGTPLVADDGSVQPLSSPVPQLNGVKLGAVWQATDGLYLHGGVNFTPGVSDRTVGGRPIQHSGVALEVSLGWHPGTRRYVPPPPPPPAPAPAPAPAPPPANRNPTVAATCDPCTIEVGQMVNVVATASDPDGDMLVYRWSAPQGSFGDLAAARTSWTAPNVPGAITLTVTVNDGRGGMATANVRVQVTQRVVIEFDPVLFDFDRFNLRPDALEVVNRALATLQANPNIRVMIEGHTDSVGTLEYNIALGDRRARAVFDYLVSRGVAAARMETTTYGEERPVATNATAEGRQQNRRAQIVIIMQ